RSPGPPPPRPQASARTSSSAAPRARNGSSGSTRQARSPPSSRPTPAPASTASEPDSATPQAAPAGRPRPRSTSVSLRLARAQPPDTRPARPEARHELGRLVQHEREQDQRPDRHLRVLRRLLEQRQDVADLREEESRQQRPDERSLPACEARAAEDGRGDA